MPLKSFLGGVLFCFAVQLSAQQLFPSLQTLTLGDKTRNLPSTATDRKMVVGLAFSAAAEKHLRDWGQPLYNALIADAMGGMMGGNMYGADVAFVFVTTGLAKLASGELKERAKKNIDRKLQDYFMMCDADADLLCSSLGITNKKEPCFFVLNGKGVILFKTSGAYSEKKLNEITDKLLE